MVLDLHQIRPTKVRAQKFVENLPEQFVEVAATRVTRIGIDTEVPPSDSIMAETDPIFQLVLFAASSNRHTVRGLWQLRKVDVVSGIPKPKGVAIGPNRA